MTFLVAGEYKREQENATPGVRVVIIDRANRPRRSPQRIEERIILPALGEPETKRES